MISSSILINTRIEHFTKKDHSHYSQPRLTNTRIGYFTKNILNRFL